MSKAKVIKLAEEAEGKWFRPGVPEQCAYFVRDIFEKAGIYLPVAQIPTDDAYPIGAGYANSFAGDECGQRITSRTQILGGDIVMFANTYGSYPRGTITHVGIAINPTEMVHHPTRSDVNRRETIQGYAANAGPFVEARRWRFRDAVKVIINGQTIRNIPVYLHNGQKVMLGIRAFAAELNWSFGTVTPDFVNVGVGNVRHTLRYINVGGVGYVHARMLPVAAVSWNGAKQSVEITT